MQTQRPTGSDLLTELTSVLGDQGREDTTSGGNTTWWWKRLHSSGEGGSSPSLPITAVDRLLFFVLKAESQGKTRRTCLSVSSFQPVGRLYFLMPL